MTADFTSRPLWSEWTMDVPAAEGCKQSQDWFVRHGYRLLEPVRENEDGSYRIVASLEESSGARRRRHGKLMLAAAVALTLVLLVMMARDIGGDRATVSLPLLAAVLLGGLGMNRLREPVRSGHKVMEATVSPTPDGGCRMLLKGTMVFGPVSVTEEPPTAGESAAAEQALLKDMRIVEGSRSSGKDAP